MKLSANSKKTIPKDFNGPFFRYHNYGGHNTEDCYIFKSKIETLIKEEHLKNFIAHRGNISKPTPPEKNL